MIERLMQVPNAQWTLIISRASVNLEELMNPVTIEQLVNIIRTNIRACTSIGHDFIVQLGMIYMDMLMVYKTISDSISQAITVSGQMALQQGKKEVVEEELVGLQEKMWVFLCFEELVVETTLRSGSGERWFWSAGDVMSLVGLCADLTISV